MFFPDNPLWTLYKILNFLLEVISRGWKFLQWDQVFHYHYPLGDTASQSHVREGIGR